MDKPIISKGLNIGDEIYFIDYFPSFVIDYDKSYDENIIYKLEDKLRIKNIEVEYIIKSNHGEYIGECGWDGIQYLRSLFGIYYKSKDKVEEIVNKLYEKEYYTEEEIKRIVCCNEE